MFSNIWMSIVQCKIIFSQEGRETHPFFGIKKPALNTIVHRKRSTTGQD